MVESTYGVHILIYLGPVQNLYNVTDIDNFSITDATGEELESIINTLTTTRLSNLNTKTWFDLVYEKLVNDDIAYLQTLNINSLKADAKITTYPKNISALY
jgi:hypothetical protein